jgi:hypothetical protein
VLLDGHPRLAELLLVESLKAGALVQRRRAETISQLSHAVHRSATDGKKGRDGELSQLIGEGVVGGVLGVIYARLRSGTGEGEGSLQALLGELTAMVVLPYRGRAAAQREQARQLPEPPEPAVAHPSEPLAAERPALPMRVTYRTLLVLGAVAERPGSSNRQIARARRLRRST